MSWWYCVDNFIFKLILEKCSKILCTVLVKAKRKKKSFFYIFLRQIWRLYETLKFLFMNKSFMYKIINFLRMYILCNSLRKLSLHKICFSGTCAISKCITYEFAQQSLLCVNKCVCMWASIPFTLNYGGVSKG